MTKINIKTFKKSIPMCYAYTTPEIPEHKGWIKIGFTEQNVEERIKQQTHTADIKYNIEWSHTAIYNDGTGDIFSDKDFHYYLTKNNIERKINKEWFKISPQDSEKLFIEFKENRGIQETTEIKEYKLRKEQEEAVIKTKKYFEKNQDDEPEFLWNAKPRFGKTLSTYDLCKRIKAKNVLIVTNRPAIANSWYSDYVKFLGTDSGFYFISDIQALNNKKFVLSRKDYLKLMNTSNKGCIEFISLQGLKGSIYFGGTIDKLEEIRNLTWDLLVIDEAHEGVDTYKTDVAFDNIKRKYTLHLSGTPFKALANNKFNENAIFNWTYADEQNAKKEWDISNEEENPYQKLPQLNLYTYKMSDIVENKVRQGCAISDKITAEYAFDLNEFFLTNQSGCFIYDDAIDKFLDALTKNDKFPFSTKELRDEINHTFWFLDRVDSVKALAKKLNEHPIFKEYKVIIAAGDGRLNKDDAIENAFNKVVNSIKQYDKTITLSVGQLTTGVTIQQWTAVMMLCNVKSPSLYMQTAFRSQNPYEFKKNGEVFIKNNAYVFDFDPARTLKIVEQFANDLIVETSWQDNSDTRKQNIRKLLNFFPVYGEDEKGEMIELDAEQVLSIPRKIYAQEVVQRGFMSNFLFQNIGNIFNAPQEIVDIIQKFDQVKEPLPIIPATKDDLSINSDGEIELPTEYILGKSTEIFGNKIYENVNLSLSKKIDDLKRIENISIDDNDFNNLKDILKNKTTEDLLYTVKENYQNKLSNSSLKKIEQKISNKVNKDFDIIYGNYKIEKNITETKYKKQLEQATDSEKDKIEENYQQQLNKVKKDFILNFKNKVPEIIKNIEYITVEDIEKHKRQKDKSEIEDSIRDHLRGFSRTIPSFLMAYGDDKTTLENFDKIIPDNVFKEVTSISLKEFRFLRDGGDYKNELTGKIEHFKGNLFDPVVFNDSIKEFLDLKNKLSNYFNENNSEDIFDYIPNQKTNQIFTPKTVIKEMVENLERECPDCFNDSNKTFIDLYMKSGLYITEIVKRLYNSKEITKIYPDEKERLKHIFEKQVYGLAPTEIIYRIAISYILGFNKEDFIKKHNLIQLDTLPLVKQGNLKQKLNEVFDTRNGATD